MTKHYILDEQGKPKMADIETWARWWQGTDRRVAVTEVSDDVRVSTVFLGSDHNWIGGEPILWETLVFGGELDGEMERYSTVEEAVEGHEKVVEKVRKAEGQVASKGTC